MVVYLRCCKDTAFFERIQIFVKLFCRAIGCTTAFYHKNMFYNMLFWSEEGKISGNFARIVEFCQRRRDGTNVSPDRAETRSSASCYIPSNCG